MAAAAFQKLIEQFPKQTEEVAQAQARLAKLGYSVAATTTSGTSVRKVWSYERLRDVMAPTPDGRYIAFRDQATGDLAIRDLTTGKNRRLTNNKDAWAQYTHEAHISADGAWIAYTWGSHVKGFDLHIIGIDGSQPRSLYAGQSP